MLKALIGAGSVKQSSMCATRWSEPGCLRYQPDTPLGIVITMRGTREGSFHRWPGMDAALPGVFELSCTIAEFGRGERTGSSGTRQIRGCTVAMGGRRPLLGPTRIA